MNALYWSGAVIAALEVILNVGISAGKKNPTAGFAAGAVLNLFFGSWLTFLLVSAAMGK